MGRNLRHNPPLKAPAAVRRHHVRHPTLLLKLHTHRSLPEHVLPLHHEDLFLSSACALLTEYGRGWGGKDSQRTFPTRAYSRAKRYESPSISLSIGFLNSCTHQISN